MSIETRANPSHAGDAQAEGPPLPPKDAPKRTDAPDSGEIEWAGGFINTPPAPGQTRVSEEPDVGEKPAEAPKP